ncbi:MAG: S8 family serine peptidase [Candidatus Kapabacteria bacterium]|nr:S8 family serine peptidase [Candidatus Kapabacteria bacterium]
MKKNISIYALIAMFAIILVSCGTENSTNPLNKSSSQSSSYLVVLASTSSNIIQGFAGSESTVREILKDHSISLYKVTAVWTTVIHGFAANLTAHEVELLRTDKRISLIEPDNTIILDDKIVKMNQNTLQAQTTPWGITAIGGTTAASSTTGVAWIVDTGIDYTHPDLNVNTSLSKNFVNTQKNANDDHGHGSHVAGIVAAKNNTVGVVGVCSGAAVIAVKVLDKNGSGQISWIVSGLDYVGKNKIANKCNVVNMSLGGSPNTTLDNAVTGLASLGVSISLAAGNSAANAGNYSPSRVNGSNIYTVSAYDANGAFATSFSNYGNPPVDYSAPGVSVYSCYKGGAYATMSGTSMAAPHVAGLLLVGNGSTTFSGYVTNDPDGTADKKAHK